MKAKAGAPPQQIGLTLAVAIGLASMLGAGVFAVFHEGAVLTDGVLGRWGLLIAIALAGLVATLNAASVYQLARSVSRAGGVYAYSRVYVNNTTSFVAGFSFIFGKIGSIAAIGLVFGIYVWPAQPVLAACLAIAALTVINLLGINRTAQVAMALSITTVTFLIVTIVWGFIHGISGTELSSSAPSATAVATAQTVDVAQIGLPILSAAAVIFFAFAGYARVATLGDEVRNARRNIPRAIAIALIAVVALYFALAFMFQQTLGDNLVSSKAPFLTFWTLSTSNLGWSKALLETIVMVVAAAASLGSILALLAGVSRTAATMAEDRELFGWFSLRNRRGAPWLAEVVIAAGSMLFAQFGRLDWAIGFSSLSVLLYYAIGHIAALKQLQRETADSALARFGRSATAWLGVFLCALLLVAVPGPAVWLSTLIIAAALFVRRLLRPRA